MSLMDFSSPGTLVRARGREWVVLPDSTPELLMVRPVGGLDEEATGILPAIENVESATFSLPSAQDVGDFASGRLLRDAARLSTRAAAGPFRSFARIPVEPRPYQFVPLMMALKLDPVRLLIADDVGIGKTIEATLIARELFDRGEIPGFTVLCPPHLAEQWQRELREQFSIEAELVLSSTIGRLEREFSHLGESLFDRHPFTIVSIDFIKQANRFHEFVRACPKFVIVDEAHGCTKAGGVGKGRQQRFALLEALAKDPERNIVLVTATPHSGNEEAFRSLLSLLREEFADLPKDLDSKEKSAVRRKLAQHLVQRRRADIEHYLRADTSFPDRESKEVVYEVGGEYKKLFDDIMAFAREYVADAGDGARRQRVRYWSALALLRCVSSSPAAAIATLRSRAAVDDVSDEEMAELGRRTVMDPDDSDDAAPLDLSPGSDDEAATDAMRRKLLEFARRAQVITPAQDQKLQSAIDELKKMLKSGYRPVVFCRFVDTAEYVARQLQEALGSKAMVSSVTGALPAVEREARIAALASHEGPYALVCTDCLSEGINLQKSFDAIMHYDLAWNPTRHEQRDGRVDRFGQRSKKVLIATHYGKNNPIDGVILDVLIRKHIAIKNDLGVAVAVPTSSEEIAEAIFEGALFREKAKGASSQLSLELFEQAEHSKAALHRGWDEAAKRERVTRSLFAQASLDEKAVEAELKAVREAIGRGAEVEAFLREVFPAAQVAVQAKDGALTIHVSDKTSRSLKQAIDQDQPFTGRFEYPLERGQVYLGRTGPIVEGLASWVLDQALDAAARDDGRALASRCGIFRTSAVTTRTTLLVTRFRYHIRHGKGNTQALLCEEVVPLAFTGTGESLAWLAPEATEVLLGASPEENLSTSAREQQLDLLFGALPGVREALAPLAEARAQHQLEAHKRVREAARANANLSVQAVLPVDILGAYVLLPRMN